MSTTARQNHFVATERVALADFTSGVAKTIFSKLPNGFIPMTGYVAVITPGNSGTSDLMTIGKALSGTAASANAFLASSDARAAANTRYQLSGLPALINDTDGGVTLTATVTKTGTAATAGEFLFVLEGAKEGSTHFSMG